ncbi:MAG: Ig-like domain-containing protein [Candidatus Aenigmatarchaeota archaeon]
MPAGTIGGASNVKIVWFAFNGTSNITGLGNLSDNQTMTWYVYAANDTSSSLLKVITLVDNNPPRILVTKPLLNSSNNAYIRGLAAEIFQVNVTEVELNVSESANNDGSTNATLWYRNVGTNRDTGVGWSKKTLACYNSAGGMLPNDLTHNKYTCNTTIDLSSLAFVGENELIQFFFNASDLVLNAGYNGTQASPHEAQVDRTAPTSSSVANNVSYVNPSNFVRLNVQFDDNFALANATLATNETETGAYFNYTDNKTRGSPITMAGNSYVLNFTWQNTSLVSGLIVGWQILATDIAGNVHATALKTFTVDADAPSTLGGFMSPARNANLTGDSILVNVSVNDTLSGVSMVYLNISYEASTGSIRGINNITLTQGIAGYWNATVNSTFNLITESPANGNYTFRIVANDTLNNENHTMNITVWIDNTAPAISITRPTAGQIVTGQFNIEALVTDAVRVARVQYRLSNATYTSGIYFQMLNTSDLLMNQSGVYNLTNVTNANLFLDGVWNVTVWANDSVNNIAQENVSITIDNVQNATELDIVSYVNGSVRKAGQTINLNFTTIGNQFGLFPSGFGYNISVYIVNSSGTAIYAGNVSNSSEFWANGTITIPANTADSVIDDGNRTFVFKTFDNGGNLMVNGSSNFTVSIDNTAASYSNPLPLNNSYITGSAAQLFQISVTEVNLNASKNVTLYWGIGPAIPTAWNAKTLLCTGTAGSNYLCNTTVDLSTSPTNKIIYYFFNNSNVTQPNGDLAGNGAGFGTEVIPFNTTIDRVNPVVGVLLPLGSANVSGSFTLNISANNTPSGIASVSYRVTNDTFQSGPIALSLGIGTAFSGYWNGTNNTFGIGLEDGLYRISINATDNAGNLNTTVNVTITIDNTKPNVTIVTPTANLNFSTSIIINATVRDSGITSTINAGNIQSVQYRLSNSSWAGSLLAMTNESSAGEAFFDMYNATNFTSANLADGRYNLTIVATDYAGNVNNSQNVTIGIDNTAPMVSIKSPTANQFIKGTFNIMADVNDAVWVKSVWYRISNVTDAFDVLGSAYLTMSNNSGVNATGGGYFNGTNITSAALFGDGLYNITVAANDTLNHVTYANVTVTIDNNVPVEFDVTTNTSEPASGIEYFPGRFYRFNKTFNDTIGVTSVIMQINATNRTAFRYEGDAQGGNWSANVTDLAANTTGYPIIWYASDTTGNWLKTTQWYYVIAKNASPAVILEVNGTQASGGIVNVYTWERGTALNITAYSPTSLTINTTLFANITTVANQFINLTALSFRPYPAGNQNITISNLNMALGIYNITANTTDNENYTANGTVAMVIVTLQDSAPYSMILSPANNSNITGSMLINVSTIDLSGVANVSYYLFNETDGISASGLLNNTGNINGNHYNVTISTSSLYEGRFKLNITAYDSIGNVNITYYFNITVDRTAPVIIFNYQAEGTRLADLTPGNNSYRSGTISANATISDSVSGVNGGTQLFRIGNRTNWMGPAFGLSVFAGAFNGTNGTILLADGLYNITITANDTVGNVRTNVTFFYVDNTAPTVIALSNSTRGKYIPNASEQIMVQVNDASQTNATIDVRAWSNNTGWTIYKTTNATPGTASIYNVTIDTSDLVDNERVKFFVMVTDNASNVATYTGSLGIPLANITIDVNCGYVGRLLNYCSDNDLWQAKFASAQLPQKSDIESISSLQSNFTVENVTKRAGMWGFFNYTYYYNGASWLSFDPNSAPSENTLKMFNNTGAQVYLFNMNKTIPDFVFRIE